MQKTLYVSRVGLDSDLGDIEDLFVTVADVQSHRLELIPESSAHTFGVFEMSCEQDAVNCVKRFNGSQFNGRLLSVVSERPKMNVPAPLPQKKSRKHV